MSRCRNVGRTKRGGQSVGYRVRRRELGTRGFRRASATFDAHVETAAGGFIEGPEEASLDEALAWARARAPRVLVILDGGPAGALEQTVFSAGTELIEEEDVHPWPRAGIGVRPRPAGTRADGADQTRNWPISIKFTVSNAAPRISQQARHLLAQASELTNQTWRQDGTTVAFRAEVRAGGYNELEAIVYPLRRPWKLNSGRT